MYSISQDNKKLLHTICNAKNSVIVAMMHRTKNLFMFMKNVITCAHKCRKK